METAHDIGNQLQHLCTVLAKQSDQALQERLNIGISQYKILRVLQDHPMIRQIQIAGWLGQTEASISRQVGLMADNGLLIITVSPKNRREHLAVPTTKGLRVAKEASSVLDFSHKDMFKKLGGKRQQQLCEALIQMHGYICQQGKKGACHQVSQP